MHCHFRYLRYCMTKNVRQPIKDAYYTLKDVQNQKAPNVKKEQNTSTGFFKLLHIRNFLNAVKQECCKRYLP